jgi:hypothetical protein
MGAGRAGWYSWNAIDNGGTPSAKRVVPGRLIVRVRVGPGARVFGLPWWAANYLVSVIHFPMQRKQLIGIARRAELTLSCASAFKTAERQAARVR